jgi:hypothetical protein
MNKAAGNFSNKKESGGAAKVRQKTDADSKSTGLVSIRAQAIIKRFGAFFYALK